MMINSIDDDHSSSLPDKSNVDYPLEVCHSLLHHCLVELNVARRNNNLSQINHYTVLHEDLSFIHSILSRYSVLPTSSCRTDSISVPFLSFITHHPGQTRTRFDYIAVQVCDTLVDEAIQIVNEDMFMGHIESPWYTRLEQLQVIQQALHSRLPPEVPITSVSTEVSVNPRLTAPRKSTTTTIPSVFMINNSDTVTTVTGRSDSTGDCLVSFIDISRLRLAHMITHNIPSHVIEIAEELIASLRQILAFLPSLPHETVRNPTDRRHRTMEEDHILSLAEEAALISSAEVRYARELRDTVHIAEAERDDYMCWHIYLELIHRLPAFPASTPQQTRLPTSVSTTRTISQTTGHENLNFSQNQTSSLLTTSRSTEPPRENGVFGNVGTTGPHTHSSFFFRKPDKCSVRE
jgi:hypothetical protein